MQSYVKSAGAKEDTEMHAAVSDVRRVVRAQEKETHRRQVERLMTRSFLDREIDVGREEVEEISELLVGLSAVEAGETSVPECLPVREHVPQ